MSLETCPILRNKVQNGTRLGAIFSCHGPAQSNHIPFSSCLVQSHAVRLAGEGKAGSLPSYQLFFPITHLSKPPFLLPLPLFSVYIALVMASKHWWLSLMAIFQISHICSLVQLVYAGGTVRGNTLVGISAVHVDSFCESTFSKAGIA